MNGIKIKLEDPDIEDKNSPVLFTFCETSIFSMIFKLTNAINKSVELFTEKGKNYHMYIWHECLLSSPLKSSTHTLA